MCDKTIENPPYEETFGGTLICADFDGTLTSQDSLLGFIQFVRGKFAFWLGVLMYSPFMVLMKLKLMDNGRTKEMLFSHFFKGMPLNEFNQWGRDFAASAQDIIRPGAKEMMKNAQMRHEEVVVVSASIINWVQPFFPSLTVLGTEAEVKDGKLTGRFSTRNCYGQEKVNRLKKYLGNRRSQLHLIAYGDSRGDKEMFEYADEYYFKPWR